MNTKTLPVLILILITTTALSGCNLPFGQSQEPPIPPTQELNLLATLTQEAIEHDIQETLTAPTITISPTTTLTPLPAETISPSATSWSSTRSQVKFRPGGTIAYFQNTIKAGEEQVFTIEAGGGQTLIASVSSAGNQATFEIKDLEQGEVLVPFSDGARSVQVKLPWTGEYQITLTSPEDLDYFLSIEVPANLVVSPGMGASVVNGTINVHQAFHPDVFTRVRYLVQLQQGSVLNVSLGYTAVNNLTLALIGAEDGQPYLRHEVQSASISGFVVPESQAYYLDVYSISGESGAFSLSIAVE
jgi:hypothetical protein